MNRDEQIDQLKVQIEEIRDRVDACLNHMQVVQEEFSSLLLEMADAMARLSDLERACERDKFGEMVSVRFRLPSPD